MTARTATRLFYLGGLPTAETYALPLLQMGISTYSSAMFNFVPEFALEFYADVRRQDRAAVTEKLTRFVLPYLDIRDRGQGFGVSIVKAGIRAIGRSVGSVRPPLKNLSEQDLADLTALIDAAGVRPQAWNVREDDTMTALELTGHSLIAGRTVAGTGASFHAIAPATGDELEPSYSQIDVDQLREATAAADEAFPSFSALAPEAHAAFLDSVADEIEKIRDAIVERAMQETGLPNARLNGEVGRTAGQLRMFAGVVRSGLFRGVRIDPAIPDRAPAPRVDIRRASCPSGRSRSSARRTSRSPSRPPAATPPRRWPPAARSSSRPTARTPARASSSRTPSRGPSPRTTCTRASSRRSSAPAARSGRRS